MKNQPLLKTILTGFSAVALVFSCGLTAFAGEPALNTANPQKDIGVYVKYVDNTEWNTVTTDENGKGTDILPDGTEVEISGADSTNGTLIIDPITDKEALDWIGDVVGGKAKKTQAFHIYYLDKNGNIKEADGVTVTLKPTNMPQNAVVYSLNTDGKATQLEFTAHNGAVTFTANGNPYYVIGEKVGTSTTPGGNAPQTGDNSNMVLWLALVLLSGSALAGTATYSKKKQYAAK